MKRLIYKRQADQLIKVLGNCLADVNDSGSAQELADEILKLLPKDMQEAIAGKESSEVLHTAPERFMKYLVKTAGITLGDLHIHSYSKPFARLFSDVMYDSPVSSLISYEIEDHYLSDYSKEDDEVNYCMLNDPEFMDELYETLCEMGQKYYVIAEVVLGVSDPDFNFYKHLQRHYNV